MNVLAVFFETVNVLERFDDLNAQIDMLGHEGFEDMFAALFCFHPFRRKGDIGDEQESS